MGLIDFWKKKEIKLDFSDENISKLTRTSDLIGQILIENGMGFYVDYLSEIRLAADNKNDSEFKKLVISNELFGGAGALWEVHIENQKEYQKFQRHFSEFIDLLIQIGIRSGRIRQIRKVMPKLT